jgi:hypothetical protein
MFKGLWRMRDCERNIVGHYLWDMLCGIGRRDWLLWSGLCGMLMESLSFYHWAGRVMSADGIGSIK